MPQLTLGISLGFLLGDISRSFRNSFDKAIERQGINLTPGEARALIYISQHKGCRQTELASLMSIEQMTASTYISRLVMIGFVSRTPDPTDRRANILDITSTGNDPLRKIKFVLDGLYAKLVEGIPPENIDVMWSGLRTMQACLVEPVSMQAPAGRKRLTLARPHVD